MMRILMAALAALCLCGLIGACATTGASSMVPTPSPLTPATSHFWCGEHCVVAAGCEEGMICDCVQLNHEKDARQALLDEKDARQKLLDHVIQQQQLSGRFPELTTGELLLGSHEIRIARGTLDREYICGVFPRYATLEFEGETIMELYDRLRCEELKFLEGETIVEHFNRCLGEDERLR